MEVQVFKEGHTLCAPLKDYIFQFTDDVDMAGYKIYHPLKPDPSIYVKTKGKAKPEDIIIKSTEKLINNLKEFDEKFHGALKSFKK